MVLAVEQVSSSGGGVDFPVLVMTLFGGLALFLFGMDRMTDALKLLAGDKLRTILQRLTANRFMGALTGAGVTAVIQSSSVTTVLVVGFVTSGLMTLEQTVGVIMGANVGTTITAQIIAFQVTKYALAFVAVGFAMSILSKNVDRKSQGAVVMGLGLIFYGMAVMSDAMRPLREFQPFIDAMIALESPLLGIAVGAAFTALIQSSSATTGLVIVMAGQGLISLEAGIALILGANIGTAVTAVLASLGKPRDASRAAMVHVLFNVVGVLIWIPFIGPLARLLGSESGDVPRQIANAHTVFNVVNVLLFIGFTRQIALLVQRIVPDRAAADEAIIRAKYLDSELLRTPSLALDRARLELLRMSDRVRSMLGDVFPAVLEGTRSSLSDVEAQDDEVDALYGHIITYLGQISQGELSDRESDELWGLMEATNNLESIGDIIETNLTALGFARIEEGIHVSNETKVVLAEFHRAVQEAVDLAMVAVTQRNREAAERVSAMKNEINSLERTASAHQAARLVAEEPQRLEAYRLEMDFIANLKRIYYFAKRTARAAVPVEARTGD
ncbi:MAG: Na/Pi cotransporter family protein [Acidimicrobiia bacterium]|nr:Na/Pi cotransporter family protein [Acidimicrobiia bacterium]MDH5293456.1 Na/Pi cotransporter family protein [Acidimicrobiia bacterium]